MICGGDVTIISAKQNNLTYSKRGRYSRLWNKMFLRVGPKTDPCGEPLMNGRVKERFLYVKVINLLIKKDFTCIIERKKGKLKVENLYRGRENHAWSNAPLMSKETGMLVN